MSSPRWNNCMALALAALLGACSAPAPKPSPAPPPQAVKATETAAQGAAPAANSPGAAAPGAPAAGAPHPEVPAAARADFDRAVRYMRAGNTTEAELGFKQVALQYPQFAAPLVDLGLLQRKQGELEQSEASLKGAVGRESGNALAWTE